MQPLLIPAPGCPNLRPTVPLSLSPTIPSPELSPQAETVLGPGWSAYLLRHLRLALPVLQVLCAPCLRREDRGLEQGQPPPPQKC